MDRRRASAAGYVAWQIARSTRHERAGRDADDRQERKMTGTIPLVVIVGGGFGGLAVAKALRRAPVNVLLIDRSNHHVFQPLLYQVATSVLAPGQIASPLRSLLAEQTNASVMLRNVTGIDAASKYVIVDANDNVGLRISYDYLIL